MSNTPATGQVVGYARVSAVDQNLARQLDALEGVDRVFQEKASGKDADGRPVLREMLAYVRPGDTVRVKSPDRLARSARDLLAIVEDLSARDVKVEFVDQPALSTGTPSGKFMLTILAAVAEMERSVIRERQAEGISLAKARGAYRRQPALTPEQIATARERVGQGVPKARIAKDLGCSRATLYEALAGRGVYAPEHPLAPTTIKE